MAERPILFSGPMVLALLDGRKTQTRRIVKGVPSWDHYGRDIMDWGLSGIHQDTYDFHNPIEGTDRWHLDVQTDVDDHSRCVIRCPYGAPGDVLWVREAWTKVPASAYRMSEGVQQTVNPADPYEAAIYAAGWDRSIPKWKPSIHMPRWACRLRLQITDVRVQRLNDCSPADALAEGIGQRVVECADGVERSLYFGVPAAGYEHGPAGHGPVHAYADLWDSINNPRGLCAEDAPHSWAANPWVWAVSFERVTP